MGITLHSNHPPDARNHTRIGEALSEPGRNHISFNTGWLIIDYGFLGQGRTEPILEVIHHQPHTRCQHVHPLDIDVAVFTDGSLLHGRWSEIPAAGASATQVDAEGNPVVSVLLTLPDHATLSATFAEHAAVLLALQHPSPCETIAIISDCASVITAQQLSFTYALSPGRPMAGVWNDIRSEPAAVRLATRVRTPEHRQRQGARRALSLCWQCSRIQHGQSRGCQGRAPSRNQQMVQRPGRASHCDPLDHSLRSRLLATCYGAVLQCGHTQTSTSKDVGGTRPSQPVHMDRRRMGLYTLPWHPPRLHHIEDAYRLSASPTRRASAVSTRTSTGPSPLGNKY